MTYASIDYMNIFLLIFLSSSSKGDLNSSWDIKPMRDITNKYFYF